MSENWFDTGDDAADRNIDEADKRREEAQKDRIYRFWMPKGDQKITFVDDDTKAHPAGFKYPFMFNEHQLNLNGSWKNWFTCIQGMKDPVTGDKLECPLCKGGNQPAFVAAYTVIDHNEWKDKNGKVHKDELKLYVVKSKVLKVLRKMSTKKEGLRGLLVEVSRPGDDDPNTGSQFDVEQKVKLAAEIVAPDYRELFKPKAYDDLKAVVGDVKGDEDRVRF